MAHSKPKRILKLAVLISGGGRTLKNLLDLAAAGELPIDVRLVVSSSAQAGGLEFARAANVDALRCGRSAEEMWRRRGRFTEGSFRVREIRRTGDERQVRPGAVMLTFGRMFQQLAHDADRARSFAKSTASCYSGLSYAGA